MLTHRRAGLELRGCKVDVCPRRKGEGVQVLVETVRVCGVVDADAGEVVAEAVFHYLARLWRKRLSLATAGIQAFFDIVRRHSRRNMTLGLHLRLLFFSLLLLLLLWILSRLRLVRLCVFLRLFRASGLFFDGAAFCGFPLYPVRWHRGDGEALYRDWAFIFQRCKTWPVPNPANSGARVCGIRMTRSATRSASCS